MQALRITQPHDYGLVKLPPPKPSTHEALIRVRSCGICGSDVDIIEGMRPREVTRYPLIMGHEFSGEVEQICSLEIGLKPGDKVAVNTIVSCGRCENCLRGWIAHCLLGTEQLGTTLPGGMAEFVAVRHDLLYKLPAQMDLAVAALAEPASCAAHGVSKADPQPGDTIVVLGCGPIGALALQLARLYSPQSLILVEINPAKIDLAYKLGATHAINALQEDVVSAVLRITSGRGANVVIDCTGNMAAIKQSAEYIGSKGRIVIIGVPPQYDLEISFMKLLFQDATFRPSNGYTTQIWLSTLHLLQEGMIDAGTIITHHFPLESACEGLALVQTQSEPAIKVMLDIGCLA